VRRPLQRITRRLKAMPQTARVRVAHEQIKRIGASASETRCSNASHAISSVCIGRSYSQRRAAVRSVAILIGQTTSTERFAGDAHFTRMAGVAPVSASSVQRERHSLHRGGNRQLNRTLHVIVIVRSQIHPHHVRLPARKPKQEPHLGMHCLKCHLAHQSRATTSNSRTSGLYFNAAVRQTQTGGPERSAAPRLCRPSRSEWYVARAR
jgi:hypothetical protein